MKNKPLLVVLTSVAVLLCGPAAPKMSAQLALPPPLPVYQPLSDQQLDQILAPIALYPDPLLAILLPAATQPTQIVLADRYLASGGAPNLIDEQPWDPSVRALAHYPSILKYLDDNLAWTTELGAAFLNQQQQVMDSIQRLRISAQNYGNLVSTPQEDVVYDNGDIEILPAEPDVIYIPVYQPQYVYCQRGFACGFGVGTSIGPWFNCDFDWHRRRIFSWDGNHPRPFNWWHDRAARVDGPNPGDRHGDRDEHHPGAGDWHNQASDNHWRNPGNRVWNNPEPQPRYNAIVPMGHAPTTLRPAAVRPTGSIWVANPSGQNTHPENHNAVVGFDGPREAGNFGNHAPENTHASPWSGSYHSEPAHSESFHTEPPHSEPAHFETPAPPSYHPAPSAPSYSSGGGGSGGSHSSAPSSSSSSRH